MFFIATYYDEPTVTYVLYNPQLRNNGVWPEGYFFPFLNVYHKGGLLPLKKLGTLERV